MSPSSPPEASRWPPGWNAREKAECLCRPNSLMGRPVAGSQRRTVPSLLAEATVWPSGLYFTQVTVQDPVAECVVHGDQVVMTLSFQIAPLPSAEQRGTIVEQALDAIDVVGRPLAFRQRHAVEIEEPLGSLPLLVRGMACRIGSPELMLQPEVVAIADGQAEDRQQGHDSHQPQGRFGGPSMRSAEHALPEADRAGSDRLAFEEVAQIVGQLAGRGIAVPRLLGHGLQTDALQVARDRPVESPGTWQDRN